MNNDSAPASDPRIPGSRTVDLKDAVGLVLAHDLTEIVPGVSKGPAFRKGHVVTADDIPRLERMGKRRLFVLSIGRDELHEDDAVALLARALCGPGVETAGRPSEGKIEIVAGRDGLLDVDAERLVTFNCVPEVMCATRRRHVFVRKGERLAGTRAIPLVARRAYIEDACRIAAQGGGLITVKPLRSALAGVVVTGSEVFEGKIQDAFAPVIRGKLEDLGSSVLAVKIAPDDREAVRAAIGEMLSAGADLVITTAGMSVDPDDVTRLAIADAGGRDLLYGAPVLPGAMLLTGLLDGPGGEVPIIGVPACALHHRTTVLDLVLPRILAGEKFTRESLARLAHGGFCMNCDGGCRFPLCGFGCA